MSETPELLVPHAGAWRSWLSRNHETSSGVRLVLARKGVTEPTQLTYDDALPEALCYGWIDGLRRAFDPDSYVIRFTPRKQDSTWSLVNIRRVAVLTKAKRMRAAGRTAFAARDERNSGIYSFEQRRKARLSGAYLREFKSNAAAWRFYNSCPPWYRWTTAFWVTDAKKDETRRKRLATLIADSAKGRTIRQLTRK